MTQPEQAVGGATDEPIIAAEPTLDDRFAALSGEEKQEEEEPQQDAPPEGEGEPLEDEPEPEAEDIPPIKAPVSWTPEEQEEFSKLPRTVQETLTRREAERERFIQSKAQEAKAVRVHLQEQAVSELGNIHTQNIAALQALLPEIPEKPSAYLQVQDPHSYAAEMDQYEWAVAQHNNVQHLIQGIAQQHAQARQALEQERGEYTRAMLQEQFPEFLDAAKGPELRQSLRSTAHALGFSDNDLTDLTAPQILALRNVSDLKAKADKYDALMTKQMERVRDAKKLPPVSRPGTPQGRGEAASQRYTADRQAMRNGDKDAGARVFSRFVS